MVILASKSPRRTELLNQIGIDHIVIPSTVDEKVDYSLSFDEIAKSISRQKGLDVFKNHPNDIVISADTIVCIDDKVLGKPKDRPDAFNTLRLLSGRSHLVVTGVCILKGSKQINFAEATKVYFDNLTDEEINEYLDTNDPFDKAGSYGIQGIFARHITKIEGDFFNVMGLPVHRVYKALQNINK